MEKERKGLGWKSWNKAKGFARIRGSWKEYTATSGHKKKTNKQTKNKTKKKTFYGRDRPKSSVMEFFFLQNLVKSALFWPKFKNFSWKFLKVSQNIFPKFSANLFQNFSVFRVIFATRNKKKTCLTDRPYLAGPSARKTWFFVFSWPYGPQSLKRIGEARCCSDYSSPTQKLQIAYTDRGQQWDATKAYFFIHRPFKLLQCVFFLPH